jgi:4'-phosphopantetheinyl transferase
MQLDSNLKRRTAGPVVSVWRAVLAVPGRSPADDLLSTDERERARRFVFVRDRNRFVAARSFLRRVLGIYTGEDPAALSFAQGFYGRPHLCGGSRPVPDFNLSHSGDLALLAVCWSGRVGIDIEAVRDLPDMAGLAPLIMHPHELEHFNYLGSTTSAGEFFRLWTRKEALLKAMGVGLSLDPRQLNVGWSDRGARQKLRVARQTWDLHEWPEAPGFAAALCAPTGATVLHCSSAAAANSCHNGRGEVPPS